MSNPDPLLPLLSSPFSAPLPIGAPVEGSSENNPPTNANYPSFYRITSTSTSTSMSVTPSTSTSTCASFSATATTTVSPMDTDTPAATDYNMGDGRVTLMSLPDELISMCYSGLPAVDLASLELVSRRLRSLVRDDEPCWRQCVLSRWAHFYMPTPPRTPAAQVDCAVITPIHQRTSPNYHVPTSQLPARMRAVADNSVVLRRAARHASSWKALYAEKAGEYKKSSPWFVATGSEVRAFIDTMLHIDTCCSMQMDTAQVKEQQQEQEQEPCSPGVVGGMVSRHESPVSIVPQQPDEMDVNVEFAKETCIVILIDASSSVADEDFKAMKRFISTLLGRLSHYDSGACVSLVQFNQHPKIELRLTRARRARAAAAVHDMSQLMGSTDIAAPIKKAREHLVEMCGQTKNGEEGEGSVGKRLVILMTDGQTHADELRECEKEAKSLYEDTGAVIHAVGVGRDIDEKGLVRIATATDANTGRYYNLRRFVHVR